MQELDRFLFATALLWVNELSEVRNFQKYGHIAIMSKLLFIQSGHAAIWSYSNEAIQQNSNTADGSYNTNQSVSQSVSNNTFIQQYGYAAVLH